MRIETSDIRDEAGLAALASNWWELSERCPSATPFQTPAWLIAWWRAFAPGTLFVVTARVGGRLVGLAPLYLEGGKPGRRLLPLGISVSDYCDLLLDPELEPSVGKAIFDHVARSDMAWENWDLPELGPHACARRIACPAGCAESLRDETPSPVLDLSGRSCDLRSVIPARKLRKLRMARHRAARRGEVAVSSVDAAQAQEAFHRVGALHEARWKSQGGEGVLADPRVRQLHLSAIPDLAGRGLLRLYELRIGGRLAGAYYGFCDRTRAYAYLGGFDPDFARESPGTILIGHAIEEAIRAGAREFHFLRGAEGYKYDWGAVDRWNRRRSFERLRTDACV